ncbi:hypothetical protein T484DRAFT_3164048 [Baffinella frigidus]|nr:hypothetical protein T484DRAFT_3164048 [Cryptophyta sp. CCMP2293]
MVVLGGGAVSYERGTPVGMGFSDDSHLVIPSSHQKRCRPEPLDDVELFSSGGLPPSAIFSLSLPFPPFSSWTRCSAAAPNFRAFSEAVTSPISARRASRAAGTHSRSRRPVLRVWGGGGREVRKGPECPCVFGGGRITHFRSRSPVLRVFLGRGSQKRPPPVCTGVGASLISARSASRAAGTHSRTPGASGLGWGLGFRFLGFSRFSHQRPGPLPHAPPAPG